MKIRNIAQNNAATSTITDETTFGDLLTILGLERRQKRQGKTPTKAKFMNADNVSLLKCAVAHCTERVMYSIKTAIEGTRFYDSLFV